MTMRAISLAAVSLIAGLALGGCSQGFGAHWLGLDDDSGTPQTAATTQADATPPAPAPAQAAAPDNFCAGVAASDAAQARANGFDEATVQRMAQTSLRQCRGL